MLRELECTIKNYQNRNGRVYELNDEQYCKYLKIAHSLDEIERLDKDLKVSYEVSPQLIDGGFFIVMPGLSIFKKDMASFQKLIDNVDSINTMTHNEDSILLIIKIKDLWRQIS